MKFLVGLACFLTCCVQQYLYAAPTADGKLSPETIKYMASLGYYDMPDPKLGEIVNDKDARQSLMDMQRFAGITPSGIMDKATTDLMKTPRCGMADMTRSIRDVKRKRRFTLQGTYWKKRDLTWKLMNDNNDGLTRAQVEEVMAAAFAKWNKATNLKFQKLDLSSTEKVDIEVKFVRNSHGDPYAFDGQGGTLAHAFYPHNNEGLSGDVHFDDDEVYTINSPSGRSLLWVAVHEIGHSIGLDHSNLQSAVMYPWYRGNGGKDFPLNEDDIIGIQNIYGGKGPDPEEPKTNGPTTTTTTVSSKPGVTATLPTAPGCPTDFRATFLDSKSQKTYIVNGDKAYILSSLLGIEKGPVEVSLLFPGVNSADALYQRKDGNIVVFSNRMFYVFDKINGQRIESGTIQSKYGVKSTVERIDAAFIWNRNGRLYLFAGEQYYRFDDARQSMDRYYPKDISKNWDGLPSSIDGAVVWRNKVTYFFKDKQYYRFDDETIKVASDYPKAIHPIWTKCNTNALKDESTKGSAAVTTIGSTILSALMFIVVRILQ